MKRILCVIAVTAAAFGAHAQDDPAVAPVETPPSACAAFVQAPSPPDGATANAAQVHAAVAEYELWQAQTQSTLDCRAAEIRALAAQGEARRNEYIAAQEDNQTRAAAFQAQLDIFSAR